MNSAASSGGADAGRRRSLPADVSGFVGRADELARLAGLLRRERLVTVTGPGGVGKTRLALRAAADAAGTTSRGVRIDSFPDGAALVELACLADPGLLADAIARSLGLRDGDPRGTLTAVLDHLRGKRLLLILDTCEHLAAACALFTAHVLRETAEVTILATSRQPLRVAGERLLRLGPLPVPSGATAVCAGDAVDLFARRATAAAPGFALTDATLPDVIRLCRRLDGIPLAIELAAVRVRSLPLAELAERLETRFSVLTGVRRGAAPRHQTLQATIEWSYDLCTPAEQAVWQRLSVFAGSFDLAVARDVASCPQQLPSQVADAIRSLIDKSVVLPAGDNRYRLLEATREFAAGLLAADGSAAYFQHRHVARYLAMAREFGRHLVADDQHDRLVRLRAEHANIRAALCYGFSESADGSPDAARLAAVLFPYWHMSGSAHEGIRWQDKALGRFTAASPERASALVNRALLGAALGRPEAVPQADEGIAIAKEVGDERTRARGYLALHLALTVAGHYTEAVAVAAQARARLDAVGAQTALRCLDVQDALCYQLAGDFAAALERCRRALSQLQPGERYLRGYLHVISALALYQQPERQEECVAAAADGLRAAQATGDVIGAGYALEVLAWLAADAGRSGRAAWLLGGAQALWERGGGGILSGNAALENCHRRAASTVADALGRDSYAWLRARGAAWPLPHLATLAIDDADSLPAAAEHSAPLDATDDSSRAGHADTGAEELTSRESEVAGLVAHGLSNREIAARLVISPRTVDAHVNHIFAKLGLSSRVQLTLWVRDRHRHGSRSGELTVLTRTM